MCDEEVEDLLKGTLAAGVNAARDGAGSGPIVGDMDFRFERETRPASRRRVRSLLYREILARGLAGPTSIRQGWRRLGVCMRGENEESLESGGERGRSERVTRARRRWRERGERARRASDRSCLHAPCENDLVLSAFGYHKPRLPHLSDIAIFCTTNTASRHINQLSVVCSTPRRAWTCLASLLHIAACAS